MYNDVLIKFNSLQYKYNLLLKSSEDKENMTGNDCQNIQN